MFFFLFEYICIFDWSQGDIIKIRTQHIPAILDFFWFKPPRFSGKLLGSRSLTRLELGVGLAIVYHKP